MRPDPDLTVSEWADAHRWLGSRASAEPGRYRTARTPYLRGVMDALSPGHPAQRISFMKAAQVGATEAGNNWIGFVIHHAPGPMLAVLPTVEMAKRSSRGRIDPLIADSPALRERVSPARSRDAGNSMLSKEFPGGILVLTGANSATGLRSMPARYVFLDEVDAYPASADEEGDPVTLAEARTTTFAHRRKLFMVSTPTIRGLSRIEREFEASDQRRYFVPCPHCGAMQWLQFERLRWESGRPETTAYHCEGCERPIAEHHKTAMLEAGEWRATAISSDPASIGFHLSALYSPIGWKSWEQIAREWLAAQGSDEMLRAARNTLLGETWVERGEAPEWQRLADRREIWAPGTVPAAGLFLTAGADVQKDRIEIDIWAWGRDRTSWLVDHIVISGGPDDPACWDGLTALLGRSWQHANGAFMTLARLGIDTGYETAAVHAWARKAGFEQVAPLKGLEGFNRATPVSGPTFVDATVGGKRLRRGARLGSVATAYLQDRDLSLPATGTAGRGSARSAGYDPSAGLGRQRMAEAARRRAAGHHPEQARLRPAGMAEAARAERGAGLPGLCQSGGMDPRRRPLGRGDMAAARGPGRGGDPDARSGGRRTRDIRSGSAPGRHPDHAAPQTAGLYPELHEGLMELERMRALLTALQEARFAGLRSVSYEGKTVSYGSDTELAAAIRDLEARIAAVGGTAPRRRRWGTVATKGL